MNFNNYLLASNPFFDAYLSADFLGKGIFLSLFATSVCSWILLLYKIWLTQQVQKNSNNFYSKFRPHKNNPLNFEAKGKGEMNPLLQLYQLLKKQTKDLLHKNRKFGESGAAYLGQADIEFIEAHLATKITTETKLLEKNLFILSTIVGLAPLLGLLGTVWGILVTFADLQTHAVGSTNQMMLSGLSLALTTTVLGLLNAIPALIAYNYLKNRIHDFATEMEKFANECLASVEMQYRKVES